MLLVTEQFFFFVPDDIISVLKGFQTVISGTILGWGANNEKKKNQNNYILEKRLNMTVSKTENSQKQTCGIMAATHLGIKADIYYQL